MNNVSNNATPYFKEQKSFGLFIPDGDSVKPFNMHTNLVRKMLQSSVGQKIALFERAGVLSDGRVQAGVSNKPSSTGQPSCGFVSKDLTGLFNVNMYGKDFIVAEERMVFLNDSNPFYFSQPKGFGFLISDSCEKDLFVHASGFTEGRPLNTLDASVNHFSLPMPCRAGKDSIEVDITPRSLNKKIEERAELG